MEVISVANQKGGCGKTTTAVNLSAYLAQKGRRTLLIDLDPQGAATTSLGVKKRKLDKTIYNVMVDDLELAEIIITEVAPGLDIAPANMNLSAAEQGLVSQPGRETIIKMKLKALNGYDYILIDTPPSLGILTLNSLVACNTLIIPVQTEYFAMEGMSQLLKIIKMVEERLLGSSIKRRYLLTMYDARTNLSKEVAEQVRGHFKDEVYKTIIPRSVKLAEAPSHGKPISLHEPDSPGALAYEQLANEVIG
ncbi:MAG: cell division inhibitor MinD [Methanosaeta sp. PtaU1.Bin060]|jgi:chromosome partitioning protein|nr:MAG: cell division inhibitor MinD [Methanosaeta sp. PtaU1.Bin060]